MTIENIFNLEHTAKISDLCLIPRQERSQEWCNDFLLCIATASMRCSDPQIFTGPDGLAYFALTLPEPGISFEPFSIAHLMEYLITSGIGVGVAINPQAEAGPDWVFSYGDIWNYRETQKFFHNPPRWQNSTNIDNSGVAKESREVLLGQPSEEYLPSYVRKVINDTLIKYFEIKEPKIFLFSDPKLNPMQNLVFNIFPENFKDPAIFKHVQNYLAWSLPKDYGLVSVPETSSLVQHFAPLYSI